MSRPTLPLNVLLIEDEALLVMDMELMVEDAGHRVIGDVASVEELSSWRPEMDPDLVLIDIHLAAGSSGLDASQIVKDRWAEAGIVFVTANPRKVPAGFLGAYGVIAKPFSRQALISTLAYLAEGMVDPPPTRSSPPGFFEFAEFEQSWAPRR